MARPLLFCDTPSRTSWTYGPPETGAPALPADRTRTLLVRGRRFLAHLGARWESLPLGPTAASIVGIGAIVVLAGTLFLFRVGAAEICSSNEAVEALVVQQMVEHGDVLAPMLNGHEPMFKPPLFHWAAAAIAGVLGMHEVTELTVRLPSVVFGLACVLLTMLFVRSWLGVGNAILSGLILLAAYQYVIEARFGRVDMALTCCESLALFALLAWLTRGDRAPLSRRRASTFADARLYVAAVALGLGVLAKGPVGMVLPLAAVGLALAIERRWTDLRALASPGPLLTLLAVSASWYLACLAAGHLDVLHRQILDENFSRFTGGIRTMSPFYYVKPVLLNSLPLSLVVPMAVVSGWRTHRARGTDAAADPRPFVLAVFWVLTLLFFSVAAYKRRAYLLPLWPPAAALLVWWVESQRDDARRRLAKGCLAVTCLPLIVFNLCFAPLAERSACGGAQYRAAARTIDATVPRREPLYFDAATSESASLLFYLDRTVPVRPATPRELTDGYMLMPEAAWAARAAPTGMRRLLTVPLGRHRLILAEGAATEQRCRDVGSPTRVDDVSPR